MKKREVIVIKDEAELAEGLKKAAGNRVIRILPVVYLPFQYVKRSDIKAS